MKISNTGGAAFFALQQALRQPQNIINLLTETETASNQPLASPSGDAAQQKAASVEGSQRATINIMV